MKMKNFWKRFWTMNVHNHEGFTLVELIIVIAILAILSSVAVVGYSSYVEKANIAADEHLMNEVKNALTLAYYADQENATAGFVILTTDGVITDGSAFVNDALAAAFGSTEGLSLKHNGWKDASMLGSATNAQTVVNSSFFTGNTPAELVDSFSTLTDALSGMATGSSQDPLITLANLNGGTFMSEEEINALRSQLVDLDVSWDKDQEAYTTAVSNLLVQKVADEIGNADEDTELTGMADLAMQYALLYGWASTNPEGAEVLEELNATLTSEDTDSGDVLSAMMETMQKAGSSETYGPYATSSGKTDYSAVISIMGTVSDWSADADMTAAGLYSSDSISDAVNNYAAAVTALSAMSSDQLAVLSRWVEDDEDGVIVFIDAAGQAYFAASAN